MPEPTTAILSRAIRLIALQEPEAYREIAVRLEGMLVRFDFEDVLFLESKLGDLYLSSKTNDSDIQVHGDRQAVIDLIAGEMTLSQAVYSGRLDIRGAIGQLTPALSAVEYFISALLRIDESDELVRALEAGS